MDTKELILDYKGKPEKFVIKKIGFDEFNQITDECMPNEMVGQVTKAHVIMGKFRTMVLLKGLKSAPFDINLDNIKNSDMVDLSLGNTLFDAINEFNRLDEPKK